MSTTSWAVLLVVVLVVVLVMAPGSSSASRPVGSSTLRPLADGEGLYLPPPPAASAGGSSSLASRCKEVFSYNDPSRYVGHADQRVQGVSAANSALSTINCGAVGVVEKGATAVGHFIGSLF